MGAMSPTELAYNYLKGLKQDASFEDIWNSIAHNINRADDNKDEIIAELYTDLVLDNRFALTSNGTWGLRDYLKFEDVKKQYDYVDKFETTEEFEDMGGDTSVYNSDSDDTNENLSRISNKLTNEALYDDDDEDEEDDEDDDDDKDFDEGFDEDSYSDIDD